MNYYYSYYYYFSSSSFFFFFVTNKDFSVMCNKGIHHTPTNICPSPPPKKYLLNKANEKENS
jgi:hypothetical protein